MHNCFQTTKETKSNGCDLKTSQNQFLPILTETGEKKLVEKSPSEVFKLGAISIPAIRNQAHLLIVSVR